MRIFDMTQPIGLGEIYTQVNILEKILGQRRKEITELIAICDLAEFSRFNFGEVKEKKIAGTEAVSKYKKLLVLGSDVVLRSIESQHGLLVARAKEIYSFSHLTFQEYFTAREIILVCQSSEEALQELVEHIFDKRWREVFLLAVALSSNAERLVLLMKEKIDNLLAEDRALQKYLQWLNEKTTEIDIRYSPEHSQKIQDNYKFYANIDNSLSRIIYLNFDLGFNRDLNLLLTHVINFGSSRFLPLDLTFKLNLYIFLYPPRNSGLEFSVMLYLAKEYDPQLYDVLLQLNEQLPDQENNGYANAKISKIRWESQENSKAWTEDFRNAMIKYQNIGHDWQFSEEQKALLEQYYYANQLLTQCLHHECYVSREVRQEIEETLLLPITEIEKYKMNK